MSGRSSLSVQMHILTHFSEKISQVFLSSVLKLKCTLSLNSLAYSLSLSIGQKSHLSFPNLQNPSGNSFITSLDCFQSQRDSKVTKNP